MNVFVFPPEEIDKIRLAQYDLLMERLDRHIQDLIHVEMQVYTIDESIPWTPVEKAFTEAMDLITALSVTRFYLHPDGEGFDPILETTDEYAAEHGLDQIPIQRPTKDLNG